MFAVCDGGLGFLFSVAPSSLAVFASASAFNSDVSKWNTGAVTNMRSSKCTLSPSLCGHALPLLCILNIRQLELHRITLLTRFVLFVFVILKRYSFLLVWWVGLFFVALSLLPVFETASAFNQDVSKWNTGAVTNMYESKCTLSFPLCGHAFR